MLCNKCGKRQASVHYKQIINGKQTEVYLCPQCANSINAFGFDDFLPNLFGKVIQPQAAPSAACKRCGMTLSQFTRGGKLGCSSCCEAFAEYLAPTLKRLHSGISHTGKRPKKAAIVYKSKNELENLKSELSKAITEERYEQAAQLRDKIRELEGKGGAANE